MGKFQALLYGYVYFEALLTKGVAVFLSGSILVEAIRQQCEQTFEQRLASGVISLMIFIFFI
jgi:hypothetical protein